MDITSILLAAQSADHATRSNAERVLKEAEEKNFGSYLVTLVDHLASDQNDPESRRLAGLIVKNAIHSRDLSVRSHLIDRWLQNVDEPSKVHVRQSLLGALAARAPEPRRAAAQVIAKVAAMDLTRPGAWESLISDLLVQASAATDDHVKQSSLEALGYTCEEATFSDQMESVLATQSNQILTTVVGGMAYQGAPGSTEDSTAAVRLAATVALNNTIEFARSQFEIPTERSAIVNTICEAARSGDLQVRQAAFEGLVKVAEHYYDKLYEYIRDIYTLTENAIRNDSEPVAMQAIEFWSTVAEEEVHIHYELETSRETGKPPERETKNFVVHALPYLSGPIFDSLKKQEDDPLEDASWNIATAAGACVELLAQAAPETILDIVKPFVESNIQDQANWRSREAAILAFGSVLEGPPPENVKTLVRGAIKVLIDTLLSDPNPAVRDTTAWTIARVISVDRDTALSHLPQLVESIRNTLGNAEHPQFAAHLCLAIHNLAECFLPESVNATGPLTEHAETLVQVLIQVADRGDASESGLRISAYESISSILRCVSEDGIPFVNTCLPMLLDKLQKTMAALPRALNDEDVQNAVEQQGLLCGALTTATHRLSKEHVLPYADTMMEAYLAAFASNGSTASLEDAFLAIGAVADAVGSYFSRYMPHFMPILQQSLGNVQHHQMCGVAVGVAGEVCRSLGKDLIPYSEKLVYLLLDALRSPTLDRGVKPTIITCFGEIAMSVKGHFEVFLKQVMECMKLAAESSVAMTVAADDYDTMDWLLHLRESVLEAYIGIVSGLRDENKQELLMPYIDWVLSFCEVLMVQPPQGSMVTEDIMKPTMALMGDLGDAIPQFREVARSKQWLHRIVEQGSRSSDERIKEVAGWAFNVIFNT